jgi:hypothetical protein
MNFARFGLNLASNFYLNQVYIVSRHVAASDCTVPVRSDRGRGPLDLKGSGRPGWTGTSSVK